MAEDEFLLEEFKQRYNQYRWLDETRAKFINYYIVLYIAFFTALGYAFTSDNPMGKFPLRYETKLMLLFLLAFFVSTLIICAIENFRFIQRKESIYLDYIAEHAESEKLCAIQDERPKDLTISDFLPSFLKNLRRFPSFFDSFYVHSITYAVVALHFMNSFLLISATYFFSRFLELKMEDSDFFKAYLRDNDLLKIFLIVYFLIFYLYAVWRFQIFKIKKQDDNESDPENKAKDKPKKTK